MATPEAEARERIDRMLEEAGWVVQDMSAINLSAVLGVAVREFPLSTGRLAHPALASDLTALGSFERHCAMPVDHLPNGQPV